MRTASGAVLGGTPQQVTQNDIAARLQGSRTARAHPCSGPPPAFAPLRHALGEPKHLWWACAGAIGAALAAIHPAKSAHTDGAVTANKRRLEKESGDGHPQDKVRRVNSEEVKREQLGRSRPCIQQTQQLGNGKSKKHTRMEPASRTGTNLVRNDKGDSELGKEPGDSWPKRTISTVEAVAQTYGGEITTALILTAVLALWGQSSLVLAARTILAAQGASLTGIWKGVHCKHRLHCMMVTNAAYVTVIGMRPSYQQLLMALVAARLGPLFPPPEDSPGQDGLEIQDDQEWFLPKNMQIIAMPMDDQRRISADVQDSADWN